jgi:dephospho-CoA kinase
VLSVGLTGGIGSGKSEVARLLAGHGAYVVDADAVAREVVAPGEPALALVADRFGSTIVRADGTLDRAALAAVVFADAAARADLEAIMHPAIRARSAALLAAAPPDSVAVYDMPLLVEQGLADAYDVVVVVDCPDEVRLARLVSGRGMAEADARARMGAQASREERLAVADFVIDNGGDLARLRAQVDRLWTDLTRAAGAG